VDRTVLPFLSFATTGSSSTMTATDSRAMSPRGEIVCRVRRLIS